MSIFYLAILLQVLENIYLLHYKNIYLLHYKNISLLC